MTANITHHVSADGLTLTSTGEILNGEELVLEISWATEFDALKNLEAAKSAHRVRISELQQAEQTGLKQGSRLWAKRFKPIFGREVSVGLMLGCDYDEMSLALGRFKFTMDVTPRGFPIFSSFHTEKTAGTSDRTVFGFGGASNAGYISVKKSTRV